MWSSCADCSPSREEQEKLNVWVALLNLENMYGSQESLTKVFERAVQYNEPLKVFLHLADIYAKSEKFQVGGWATHELLGVPGATVSGKSPWGSGSSPVLGLPPNIGAPISPSSK